MRKLLIVLLLSGCLSTFSQTYSGHIYHIGGTLHASYDLVDRTPLFSSASELIKDIKNTDLVGTSFTGSWTTGTGNNTMFVKDNTIDFNTFSSTQITNSYNSGVPASTVTNPSNGDIFIAKLRSTDSFAVIKITNIDPTDSTCACSNVGKMTFDFEIEESCPENIPELQDNVSICLDDDVILNGGVGYSSYSWNTGSNAQSITVSDSGMYVLTVTDDNGCITTDTAIVTVLFPPDVSIVKTDDLLTANVSESVTMYQWLLNGNEITGANLQSHQATENGYYQVKVQGTNNCWNTSESLVVEVGNETTIARYSSESSLTIYPNPTNDKIYFKNLSTPMNYTLINALGQIVKVGILNSNVLELDNYSAGIYKLLTIDQNNKIRYSTNLIKN